MEEIWSSFWNMEGIDITNGEIRGNGGIHGNEMVEIW